MMSAPCAGNAAPIAAMRLPLIRKSASNHGAPVPSISLALRISVFLPLAVWGMPLSSSRRYGACGRYLFVIGDRLDAAEHHDVEEDADQQHHACDHEGTGKGLGPVDHDACDDRREHAHHVVGEIQDAADGSSAAL